jgi:hypothetical protein
VLRRSSESVNEIPKNSSNFGNTEMNNFNKISVSIRRTLGHNMSKEVKLRHQKTDLTAKPALLFSFHICILRRKDKKTLVAEHMGFGSQHHLLDTR